jgi:hypothetical protein
MERSSWDANSRSATQEIPRSLLHLEVHNCVHSRAPLAAVLKIQAYWDTASCWSWRIRPACCSRLLENVGHLVRNHEETKCTQAYVQSTSTFKIVTSVRNAWNGCLLVHVSDDACIQRQQTSFHSAVMHCLLCNNYTVAGGLNFQTTALL